MADPHDKDTEQLLAEAEADGYVDVPPEPVGEDDPDWVEPAAGCTPIGED
jgi:hypothetical protein